MLRPHRRAHARFWTIAAFALPAIVLGGVVLKLSQRRPPAPLLLAPPETAPPGPPAEADKP